MREIKWSELFLSAGFSHLEPLCASWCCGAHQHQRRTVQVSHPRLFCHVPTCRAHCASAAPPPPQPPPPPPPSHKASAVLCEVRRRKLQLCFHGFCRCVSQNSVVFTVSSFSKHLIGGKCPPPPTFPLKIRGGGGRGRRLRWSRRRGVSLEVQSILHGLDPN